MIESKISNLSSSPETQKNTTPIKIRILQNTSDSTSSEIPSTLLMAAGETVAFSAAGGSGDYTFFDSGSGFINSLTGLYSIPLQASLSAETISVKDSDGQSSSLPISIQKWRYVDDPYSPQNIDPIVQQSIQDISVSPGGIRYVGINAYYDYHIMKSTDGGASYTISDSYTLYLNEGTQITGIKAKSDTEIFATATAQGGSNSFYNTGVIRRSLDGGSLWTTVDTFSTGHLGFAADVEIDAAGNIFVSGSDNGSWIIKKSSDNGTTWSTIYTAATSTGAKLVYDASSNSLFASGTNAGFVKIIKSTNSGSSWTLMDSFQGTNGTTVLNTIAVKGNLVVYAGYSGNSGWGGFGWPTTCGGTAYQNRWFTRVSLNSGTSWTTTDEFQRSSSRASIPVGIAITSTNQIYVGGDAQGADDCYSVLVRTSSDNGATWSDSHFDNNVSPNNNRTKFFGLVFGDEIIHSNSVQSIAGAAYPWVFTVSPDSVRHSTNGGSTWSNSNLKLSIPYRGSGIELESLNDTTLVASGAVGYSGWQIKKSTDLGTSWSTVDTFELTPNASATPNSVLKISDSTLIAAGSASDAAYSSHWIVRRSIDSGSTWSLVDDFRCPGNVSSSANNIVKYQNDLFVVGYCYLNAGTAGVVRKSSDNGASWTTVSTFQKAAGKNTFFDRAAVSSNGSLFILGKAADSANINYLTVLKSTDGGVTFIPLFQEPEPLGSQFLTTNGSLTIPDVGMLMENSILISYFETTSSTFNFKLRKISPSDGTSSLLLDSAISPSPVGTAIVLSKTSATVFSSSKEYYGQSNTQVFETKVWRSRDGSNWNLIDQNSSAIMSAKSCGGANDEKICTVGSILTNFAWTETWITRLLSL